MCCVNETTIINSGITLALEPVRIDSFTLEKSRKRVRRVSFEKAEVVATVPPSSAMSDNVRNELWYQQTELTQFKNDARDLCRQIRGCDAVAEQPLLDTRLDLALEPQNDCARGLEHRISMERQKNKYLAMRAIVKAQQRYQTAEQLAIVASKCTAWAKEVALCTGYQDFYQAYNPTLVHLVPTTPTVKFPLLSRKRSTDNSGSSSGEEDCAPAKKQRTISPVPMRSTKTLISPPVILLR